MQTRRCLEREIAVDPIDSAKAVGLRYVTDQGSGISRTRVGKDFDYRSPSGGKIDAETRARIRALAIPPAWADVWICPVPNGHLQATGKDVRGRKQYRYHPRWREIRDETKYNRMIEFGRWLPKIRHKVSQDLQRPGLPKEKVLAAVVRLLEVSLIRVGNEEYARANKSFGLTTMRDKHVEVTGSKVHFQFRGKSGKQHQVEVDDPRLARIVKNCRDIPGQELFQYLDSDGQRQTIGSSDVNVYLKSIAGRDFTAKDFRTWAGTVLAARALHELEKVDSVAGAKKNIVRAIEAVSEMLGNTPTICRKCYIHPAVIQAYLDGALVSTLRRRADEKLASQSSELRPEETGVLALLRQRLAEEENGQAQPGRRLASGSHRPRSRSRGQGISVAKSRASRALTAVR